MNEEFQSANEELLTSKEELQSLNEELTALNNQLQETLDRQRTTSDDLQNVLYSTDVATIFLDASLNIRFFTPATRALFNVIASDVGRPLADLVSRAADEALLSDARVVLAKHLPVEREIETPDGHWFMRRILPYRTQAGGVEGVVITFVDITERVRAEQRLVESERRYRSLFENMNSAASSCSRSCRARTAGPSIWSTSRANERVEAVTEPEGLRKSIGRRLTAGLARHRERSRRLDRNLRRGRLDRRAGSIRALFGLAGRALRSSPPTSPRRDNAP